MRDLRFAATGTVPRGIADLFQDTAPAHVTSIVLARLWFALLWFPRESEHRLLGLEPERPTFGIY